VRKGASVTDPIALKQFASAVKERFGIETDDPVRAGWEAILGRRQRAVEASSAFQYVAKWLAGQLGPEEDREVAVELSVPETYFFRYPDHFEALGEVVLPSLLKRPGLSRTVRVLSIGCASGDEPYSLAIVLRERGCTGSDWNVVIRGIDVNGAMLSKARQGRYTSWSLRSTSADLRARYFQEVGAREFEIAPEIRSMVDCYESNLLDDDPRIWGPERYDIVFCRNVIIYLCQSAIARLVSKVASALTPGGFFFVGHAENLGHVLAGFAACTAAGCYFHQRVQTALPETSVSSTWSIPESRRVETADRPSALSLSIPHALAEEIAAQRALEEVLELVRQDRPGEGLARLAAMQGDIADRREIRIAKAALLVNAGGVADAETLTTQLLASDPLDAEAWYIRALCRERSGDRVGALDAAERSGRAEPAFALVRLYLGLQWSRRGDRIRARQELGDALRLLGREPEERLLLFGGGFGRNALMDVCRHELERAGKG
jgi:chemotaxis protein methyltransferase CheR